MKGEMVRGQHSYSQTRAQRCIQEVADDHLILWQQIKKSNWHFTVETNLSTLTAFGESQQMFYFSSTSHKGSDIKMWFNDH